MTNHPHVRTRAVIITLICSLIASIMTLAPTGPAAAVEPPAEPSTTSCPLDVEPVDDECPDLDADHDTALDEALEKLDNRLTAPGWQISPSADHNQVVNLDTWLHVVSGWDTQDITADGDHVEVTVTAEPIESVWTFTETSTGFISEVRCSGPGAPWSDAGGTPPCGKTWEHSSDVTGPVTLEVRLVYAVAGTSDLHPNKELLPQAETPNSAPVALNVVELQTFGVDRAPNTAPAPASPPAPAPPEEESCGGWLSFCAVGVVVDKTVDGVKEVADDVVEVIEITSRWVIENVPGAKELISFIEGCAEFGLEALQSIGDVLKTIGKAATDFQAFLDEQWAMIQGLKEAALANPTEFALEFLGDLVDWDLLKEDPIKWAGKMACELLASIISSGAVGAIGKVLKKITPSKLKKFLDRLDGKKNDRDKNDDGDKNDDDSTSPCRLSSFPPGTQVLIGDGTHLPIDAIRPGDYVISHNLDTSAWEPKLVLDQWSHLDRGPPATATLIDGSTITATDDHLFWVASSTTWTELQQVEPGDQFLTPAGTVDVEQVALGQAQPWTVWELTVADNHNFTVRSGQGPDVLVHNCRTTPKHKGNSVDDGPAINGDTDYDVYDPNATHPKGRRITDIDEVRDGKLIEHKSLDHVPDAERWIDKHIRDKTAKYKEAREHIPGFEDAPIEFEISGGGADAVLRGEIEKAAREVGATVTWTTPTP